MAATCAHGCQKLCLNLREGFKGLLPLLILTIYTILGALLFRELEGPHEQFKLETQRAQRAKLLDDTIVRLYQIRVDRELVQPPLQTYNHTKKRLLQFQEELGIVPPHQEIIHWSFWGAIFFCVTVYTTIGYGNIVPETGAGQTLTIIYAVIGIPLALSSLFCLGAMFARLCRVVWNGISKGIVKGTSVVSTDLEKKMTDALEIENQPAEKKETSDDLLSFPISFLVLITVLWIFVCALIFFLIEDWDYGTALYFTLISFLTIGFGDVLPSEYDYMIVVAILLLIGLSLVSTVLTIIQQQIEALGDGMEDKINEEYQQALANAADEGEFTAEEMEEMQNGEGDGLDAVVARMPLRERLLFKVMPNGEKKKLQASVTKNQGRRTKSSQTDMFLLEGLLREELLKMELNSELDKLRPTTAPESPFLPLRQMNFDTAPRYTDNPVLTADSSRDSPAFRNEFAPSTPSRFTPQTSRDSPALRILDPVQQGARVLTPQQSRDSPALRPIETSQPGTPKRIVSPQHSRESPALRTLEITQPGTTARVLPPQESRESPALRPEPVPSTSRVLTPQQSRESAKQAVELSPQTSKDHESEPLIPPPRTRGFKIDKVQPIEEVDRPSTITTTVVKEDEV